VLHDLEISRKEEETSVATVSKTTDPENGQVGVIIE
jgi:hypothetical protein